MDGSVLLLKEDFYEQEDLWIYEPEMAVLLHGAFSGRRDRRNRRIRPLRSGFAPLVGVSVSPGGETRLPWWSFRSPLVGYLISPGGVFDVPARRNPPGSPS